MFNDPEIWRNILDGLQIGVSVLDLQKRIVFWSECAEHITGYSGIDVLGHGCVDNIMQHCNQTSCDMCGDQCPIVAAMHDGKPTEAMMFVHHKSGHHKQVHTWAIPLRNQHGSLIGVIQTFEGEFALGSVQASEHDMRDRGRLDDATGLPNAAIMKAHLRELLGTFVELEITFGVLFLELPELAGFRARYGQVAARSILQVLAHTLKNTVWPTDFVGRWAEDRFMLILNGCCDDAFHAVSQRILKMAGGATIQWWGQELSMTARISGTIAIAGDTMESLLSRAQQGLRDTEGAVRQHPTLVAAVPSAKKANS